MIRILGIDVGIAITGWSIIDIHKDSVKPVLTAAGAIVTKKGTPEEVRLKQLFDSLIEIIEEYKPKEAAVEKLFFFKNKKTIISVGQARGVILLALSENGIAISHYTPTEVKTAVSGYGKADKTQVQKMVQLLFNLKEIPKPDDVADAIAVGYCHASTGAYKDL